MDGDRVALPAAGLAMNQHGAVHQRRPQFQHLEHLLHRTALTDDGVETVAIAQLRAQIRIFLPQPALFPCPEPSTRRELRDLERFDQEVGPRRV